MKREDVMAGIGEGRLGPVCMHVCMHGMCMKREGVMAGIGEGRLGPMYVCVYVCMYVRVCVMHLCMYA